MGRRYAEESLVLAPLATQKLRINTAVLVSAVGGIPGS